MSHTTPHPEQTLNFYQYLHKSFLARARYHGFPEELTDNANVFELYSMVKNHELELLELSKRMIKAANWDIVKSSAEVAALMKGGY